jgi:formiminotetrahydrofolate cyclodeaminase
MMILWSIKQLKMYDFIESLKKTVEKKRLEKRELLSSNSLKSFVDLDFKTFVNILDESKLNYKYNKKEEYRIAWMQGYIQCAIDFANLMGIQDEEANPTETEIKQIEAKSHEFVNTLFEPLCY